MSNNTRIKYINLEYIKLKCDNNGMIIMWNKLLVVIGGVFTLKIGDRIRQLRTSHFLTQHELAKKIDVAQSTLAMYERNKRIPSADVLNNLSAVLNVSIDYLIRGNESEDETEPTKKAPSKSIDEALDNVMSFDGQPVTDHDRQVMKQLLIAYLNGKN